MREGDRDYDFYVITNGNVACRDQPVAIVGGGSSAGQAAVFLSKLAGRVRIFIRGGDLSMSRYLVDRIEQNPAVEVHPHSEVRELLGDRTLEGILVEDNRTGERRTYEARDLFVFIGADPCVQWLAGKVGVITKTFTGLHP